VIIIQKALGRDNIDEVIRLSEDYKVTETKTIEMSGARSNAGNVIEERRTEEVFTVPPPPPASVQIVEETKITETQSRPSHHHYHHGGAHFIDAEPRDESTFIEKRREVYESSAPMTIGPMALVLPPEHSRGKDERAIRAEIRALEAEKEALRAERRADREMRKAERIRREGRHSESDLVLYDQHIESAFGEEYTLVRREKIEEPEGGVRIEKDRKVPPPRLIRAMLKTLT